MHACYIDMDEMEKLSFIEYKRADIYVYVKSIQKYISIYINYIHHRPFHYPIQRIDRWTLYTGRRHYFVWQ